MQGQIGELLGKLAQPEPGYAAVLRTCLDRVLTPAGQEALDTGQMGERFGETLRAFRNPPAHNEFVTLPQARACQDYVRGSRERLDRWLVPGG